MKKQTAVDWLIEKIQLTDTIIDNGESSYVILFPNLKLKDIEQAKAIEKVNSEISFFAGYNYEGGHPIDEHEEYYTETFTETKND